MSWIYIDKEKCNECGLCASVCLHCFSRKDKIIVQYANEELCILCGHCVAVCPTDAILHNKLDMDAFIPLDKKGNLETQTFISFLQGRRSHRNFKKKEVPRGLMDTLIDVCSYAPTGSNDQKVEILVLQDKKTIRKLSDMTADYFRDIISQAENRAKKLRSEGEGLSVGQKNALQSLLKNKRLEKRLNFEIDPIFHEAPAVIIFHSTPHTSTPKDNCVIAAHTMALTAITMGLETCYVGLLEIAANSHPPIEEELNLPNSNRVYSVLIVGYPKYEFLRAVYRKPINVRWE